MKTIGIALVVIISGTIALGWYKTHNAPAHLYHKTGEFSGCPARPSCVSSVAIDPTQRVAPLEDPGNVPDIVKRLRLAVDAMGGEIAAAQAGYLHAVFTTPRMRYRDDLELLIREDGTIDVRSISRFGYRDFGVNRDRVEQLRTLFKSGFNVGDEESAE